MIPHVHAELIKQWADGAMIQFKDIDGFWIDVENPTWSPMATYRIKPKARVIWIIGPQEESLPPNMHGFEYRRLYNSNQLIGLENPQINWTKHWWKHIDNPFRLLEIVISRTR